MIFRRALRSVIEAQEHAADQIARTVAGACAIRNAIRVVDRASSAYHNYWQTVALPTIKSGYRPHLAEQFVEYLQKGEGPSSPVKRPLVPAVGFAAFEFHPSVQSQLSNLRMEADMTSPQADPAAITLIINVEEHERQILADLGFNGLAKNKPNWV